MSSRGRIVGVLRSATGRALGVGILVGLGGAIVLMVVQLAAGVLYVRAPLVAFSLVGAWLAPALVAMQWTRQPGSGAAAGAVVALSGLFSFWPGVTGLLLNVVLYGLLVEAVFALWRYRVWTRTVFLSAGMVGGLGLGLVQVSEPSSFAAFGVVTTVVSGALTAVLVRFLLSP